MGRNRKRYFAVVDVDEKGATSQYLSYHGKYVVPPAQHFYYTNTNTDLLQLNGL